MMDVAEKRAALRHLVLTSAQEQQEDDDRQTNRPGHLAERYEESSLHHRPTKEAHNRQLHVKALGGRTSIM